MIAMLLLVSPALAVYSAAPCIRPLRAGTQVQGEVRICPGRYRIADPSEHGVIIAAASGTRIDLSGVILESGDSIPGRYVGVGIASRDVDGVSVLGGTVRGYRFGVRLEGGRSHRISGIDVSGSRSQPLRSTAERPDSTDRLDWAHLDPALAYGGGVLLRNTTGASVVGVTARRAQNGIGLVEARESYVAGNDVSGNSGWGLQLWLSSHNTVVRNQVDHVGRCPASGLDCGAAAILLREGSDSNLVGENQLGGSSVGVMLSGAAPLTRPSVGNLIFRNDASGARNAGFSATGAWNTLFLENRADSAGTGFRLDRSVGGTLRGNTVIDPVTAAIMADQAGGHVIVSNVLLGGRLGIRFTGSSAGRSGSRGPRIDDNTFSGQAQAIVLQGTSDGRVRGNVFDRVGDALVIDGEGHNTEVTGNVFLRASGWYIDAPDLGAGGNYWATADAAGASAKVRGRISVLPWKPASAAGY
jgi:parallel beta-helix repeat protein